MSFIVITTFLDVHFSLSGENFTTNIALNLADIGDKVNTLLLCVTSFTRCCRHNETGTNQFSGLWRFPNGPNVTSRLNITEGIRRTRGLSSVILHRLTNESSPTGVYTCEILDGTGNITKIFAQLYFKVIQGTVMLILSCIMSNSSTKVISVQINIVFFINQSKLGVNQPEILQLCQQMTFSSLAIAQILSPNP